MRPLRKAAIICTTIAIGLVAGLVLLEIVFRFLPVRANFARQPVTAAEPYIHYAPDVVITHSLGWDFYVVQHRRTNNYGYLADRDFEKGGRPAIALIGDSFVQAAQVRYDESLGGLLDAATPGAVYPIAMAGAPLSQYLAFARFAEAEFEPEKYVIVVVGNDFDQSLCGGGSPAQGHHCYDEDLSLRLIPNTDERLIRTVGRESALLRYLVFNVGVNWRASLARIEALWRGGQDVETTYAGNTEAAKPRDIVEESRRAVDRFLVDIRRVTDGKPVLFVVDADRRAIYAGRDPGDTYFDTMRAYFRERAQAAGFPVLDMTDVFAADWQAHGARFEFPTDGHWNARAHRLAAEAVREHPFYAE